jgi:predicted PurR-regulated permease PerM
MIAVLVAINVSVTIFLVVSVWYIWDEYQNTYEDVKELMNEFIINNGNVNEKINEVLDLNIEKYMDVQKALNEEFAEFVEAQRKLNFHLLENEITDRFKKSKGVRK